MQSVGCYKAMFVEWLFQLKDLKRQLQAERKRADKLQEKLQEVLSESARGRQCKLLPADSFEKNSLDSFTHDLLLTMLSNESFCCYV